MNLFTTLATAIIPSLLNRNSSEPNYTVPTTNVGWTPEMAGAFQNMMQSSAYQRDLQMGDYMSQIESSMNRRGIPGSGLEAQQKSDMLRDANYSWAMGNKAMSLDMLNSMMGAQQMQNQMTMQQQQLAQQQSLYNQQQRSQMMGALGNLFGTYAAGGFKQPANNFGNTNSFGSSNMGTYYNSYGVA